MKAQVELTTEGARPSLKKEQKNSANKDRSKSKINGGSDKVKPPKPTVQREPVKKLFRIVIRKLPARDFSEADVQQCLDRVCCSAGIGLNREAFTLEHYVAGKISRKRGQVSSAAFVAVNDEVQYWRFLAHCPLKIPFIEAEDASAQPEIAPAPNQKAFKLKDRSDKLLNTHETDPFFAAFTAKLSKTVDKLPSAEAQLDTKKDNTAQTREELIKNNPLLKYMREKAEKKMMERRLLKRGSSSKSLQVSSVLTKSGSKSGSKSGAASGSGSGKGGKERTRGGRDKNKDSKEGREGKPASSSGGAAGGAGAGAGEGASSREAREPREPREPRGGRDSKDRGRGRGKDKDASAAGEGGSTAAAPAVPKFTIAKRGEAPVAGGGGGVVAQGTCGAGAGSAPGSGGGTGGGQGERKERPPRRDSDRVERTNKGAGASVGAPSHSGGSAHASEGTSSGGGRGGRGRGGGGSGGPSGGAGRGENSRVDAGRNEGGRGRGSSREGRGGQGQNQQEGHSRSSTAP